jgi:ubiquitin-activating enzyme E1
MEGKKNSKMEIDEDLYSRQIGTFGMEAMGKLIQMKILIFGLRGLGIEIAKNIILAGPKSVTLYDPEIVTLSNLGSNFYLNESHIGKTRRDEASIGQLKELNPYVDVSNITTFNMEMLLNYNVVVMTEMYKHTDLIEINRICHENKIGFIYTCSLGLSGFTFVDFGDNHMIRDDNGEECKQYIVKIIEKYPQGIVTIDDGVGGGKIALSDGDYVTFKEVQGMTELNNQEPRPVELISPVSIAIGDVSNFGEYIGGGIMEQVKVPKPHQYSPLSLRFENPYNGKKIPDPIDLSKFGRNELLHCGFLGLNKFFNRESRLPELNNEKETNEVIELARETYNSFKTNNSEWIKNAAEFDDKVIRNIARFAKSQIVPVTSFLGGVVAQEIVKFTGKYTPIDQWLWFDFFEVLENLPENVNRNLTNTRYDDQISIFGQELQEKLFKSNVFMIGAGALGCEFIKEFALMGLCIDKEATCTVTDNDNIEISNLNRQFLFRREDVHNPKSKTACNVVKRMNPNFNSKDLQALVSPDNEHVFNDKFWEKQTFIINAVDNVKARKYIDSKAVWYGKPLIDSGTLGTKAHVQLIVPNVTSCYNDTQDPVEESIPMCLLHNFPAMIEHCIQWARDNFNGYFTDVISDCKNFLVDKQKYYDGLKKEGNISVQLDKLNQVKKIIEIANSNSFEKCIEFAVERYTQNFDHNIMQLLYNFPEDYVNNDGSKFWSGAKRVPHPLKYNPNDKTGLGFVSSYAIILARGLGIKENTDFDYIKQVSANINVRAYVPKKIKIKLNETDPDENNFGQNEENELANLTKELSLMGNNSLNVKNFVPHEFEKDDDSNFHIDFVNFTSNLRARNYRIQECDRLKTKLIAGKIIPAIATTTASITGLVALQIYTVLITDKIEAMRNAFMNLAMGLFVLTEPQEKICMKDKEYDPIMLSAVKAIPPKWTVWDKILIEKSMTIQEFIDYFNKTYEIEISIITSNNVSLIQTFQASNKNRYAMKIEDVYNTYSKNKLTENIDYLVIDVSADTIDGAAAIMPLIKYKFK